MSVLEIDDLKAHLAITDNTDDDLLEAKISAAEAWVASFLGAPLDDTDTFPEGTPNR